MSSIIRDPRWLIEAFSIVDTLSMCVIKDILDRDCSPEELAESAGMSEWQTRAAVSLHPNTTIKTLQRLAKDKDLNVRKVLASNEDTPMEILRLLGKEKKFQIKYALATNSNTPIEILESLADDKNETFPIILAGSSSVPENVLRKLIEKDNYKINFEVARNPNTPLEVLLELIKRKCSLIFIAANPKIPMGDLKNIFPKSCIALRNYALSNNHNTPGNFLRQLYLYQSDNHSPLDKNLAGNPKTPLDVLKAIYKRISVTSQIYGQGTETKICLAMNPRISKSMMRKLSQDQEIDVRCALALNGGVPVSILNALSKDVSDKVQLYVVCNSKTPMSTVEKFIHKKSSNLLNIAATLVKWKRESGRAIKPGFSAFPVDKFQTFF